MQSKMTHKYLLLKTEIWGAINCLTEQFLKASSSLKSNPRMRWTTGKMRFFWYLTCSLHTAGAAPLQLKVNLHSWSFLECNWRSILSVQRGRSNSFCSSPPKKAPPPNKGTETISFSGALGAKSSIAQWWLMNGKEVWWKPHADLEKEKFLVPLQHQLLAPPFKPEEQSSHISSPPQAVGW